MENKLKKIFTLLIVILPIMSQYSSMVPGFSIGDLLLFLIMLFIIIDLLKKKPVHNINKIVRNPFIWFISYIIFGSLISVLFQYYSAFNDVAVRSTRYIFYIILATYISSIYFDFNNFMKWYRRVVIFATLFLFVQLFLFNFKGYVLMGTIPGLEISNPGYSEETMRNLYSYFYRPSSIFLEPGYFPQYTLPYLAYLLFKTRLNVKYRFLEAILLTIAIIFTTSGQGIVISFFVWSLWLLTKFYNSKSKKINIKFIMAIVAFIILIPIIINHPTVDRSLGRLFGTSTASSNSRIFRGFFIYKELGFIYKIIGVGYGNVGAHILHNQIYTVYDSPHIVSEYMNSVAYILVNLGVIGFIFMIWIFIYLWKNTSGFNRVCVYILILLSGVSTFFLSNSIVFYLPIILSVVNKQNDNKRCVNNLTK